MVAVYCLWQLLSVVSTLASSISIFLLAGELIRQLIEKKV